MKGNPDQRTTITARIAPELADRLQREAERRDVSVNLLVVKAIERTLPAWEGQELP